MDNLIRISKMYLTQTAESVEYIKYISTEG